MARFKVTYIVNHVSFFVSHRLPIAEGAKSAEIDVSLVTGQAGSPLMEATALQILSKSGIRHSRVSFRSSGLNPLVELRGFLQICRYLLGERPDIVHCVSPKGVLYGGIAARLCGAPALVLAISGMGYAYTPSGSVDRIRRFVKTIYSSAVRLAFGHNNLRVIVQNPSDYAALVSEQFVSSSQLTLIPGSGVDLGRYTLSEAREKDSIVILPARMLRDKGVREFVEAARILKTTVPGWRFVLAGAADYQNPSAFTESEILAWQREGCIEWLGHVDDMLPWFRRASIVCLPSYREGMPKALLEAAAARCAVVTTDVAGCRDAIVEGQTGDLVPPRDSVALSDCLLKLIQDPDRRLRYGSNGYHRACQLFSLEAVVQKHLKIYQELLNS